ncbi:GH36-type glycosyl hydrolase domain-containing protein, partial [Bacteroidota bacterium]
NAGGYSFYKSAAQGRYTRFKTNAIPMDQPGRYIYLRDQENGDYWSGSWQPVGKSLDQYKSICRHGTAYTTIESDYSKIKSETTYFVPLEKNYECWLGKVTNNDNKIRKLRLFTYLEYASNWHLWMDMINLQYTQYILTMDVIDNIIDQGTNIYLSPQPDNFEEGGQARHTFFGLAGAEVSGFDTDRKKFIGPHHSYSNPIVVQNGKCTNSIAVGDNGCGTLQFDIELKPGESKEFVVVMGIGSAGMEGKSAINNCKNISSVKNELEKVKQFWHSKIEGMIVDTPDSEFNSMMNMWNPYNCLITYAWSRAASLVYAGERDGLGYRDTVQDLLGVLHTIPEEAEKRLELMITGQVSNGGAMPVVKPFSHYPGKEKLPDENEYRSDDCLWLFNTIPAYVKETGNIEFYNKVLPYADKGEDTVLGHLKKTIEFNLERSGVHGLPCGLAADWNDCLVLGQKGETVFVAFQLRFALDTYIEICNLLDKQDEINWASKHLENLDKNLDEHAWDGEWYLRAYKDDGLKYGSRNNEEGSLWLNPQSWSVYSGHASKEKAQKAMKAVSEKLATEYGVVICDPPYKKADLNVIKATLFNESMKENGAIFCHTQGWAIIAETLLDHGNQAYKYYRAFMPAAYNTKAEIREIEPYVYCQSTHGKFSPRMGASRLAWLSGAATWAYYSASQYILGVQPQYNGIKLDPCIPSDWTEFKISRRFRNKTLNIIVKNNNSIEKGVEKIIINGNELNGNFIPNELLKDNNEITVIMNKT